MKHKFSGETCVYCGKAASESSDHVVARKFFRVEQRGDLPQAPSCKRCNNRKSQLENYLMKSSCRSGRKTRTRRKSFGSWFYPRLENKANAKLLRKLQRGYDRSGGMSFPVEP